ncbi:MAG: hypothetical protein H6822_30315 [Planctomycetaceae bacterium]|nr:hypothetical protein [Planctomycetales bacterium]MCB9926478.1 hypothetical protein [Planctomycetaceae bacterium]
MPQLPDPSGIRNRPASVALGELAIAAGVVGESLTITSGFAANTLCQIWKYYTQMLGAGNVIHVRSKRDLKDFAQRIASVRAVFVYAPRFYQDVAWQIHLAVAGAMSPRPPVFCGFQHDDPDLDPGFTLPLSNDERETTAVHNWVAGQGEHRFVEIEYPSSVEHDARLESILQPSSFDRIGLDFREQRIVEALIEGAALLRSAANQDRNDLVATLGDYEFVRRLLCSPVVRPNRELCEPLAAEMMSRANVYLSVKLGSDRRNPFRVPDDDGYRRSSNSALKRDAITRRELADLGNINSRMVATLIEYLQRADDGYARYLRMSCTGDPIAERGWRHLTPREVASSLKSWSSKQVRTHFDRLHQRGLVTAEREQMNGPLNYRLPEELENVGSPYSKLPALQSLTQNHTAA